MSNTHLSLLENYSTVNTFMICIYIYIHIISSIFNLKPGFVGRKPQKTPPGTISNGSRDQCFPFKLFLSRCPFGTRGGDTNHPCRPAIAMCHPASHARSIVGWWGGSKSKALWVDTSISLLELEIVGAWLRSGWRKPGLLEDWRWKRKLCFCFFFSRNQKKGLGWRFFFFSFCHCVELCCHFFWSVVFFPVSGFNSAYFFTGTKVVKVSICLQPPSLGLKLVDLLKA